MIPNKVFQSLASGRPVITRASAAYPLETHASPAFGFVPPGDPQALATAVSAWALRRENLSERAQTAREIYTTCFSSVIVCGQLEKSLEALRPSQRP